MKSFTNDVVNNWRVELDQDSTLRQFMPMLNFTLDNSGDSEVNVFLHGESVGSCYGYATFSVMGKPFESFRVEGVFNIGDLTVNVSKMEVVTAMPFNPQIDLMEENLDKFASGTDSRISYSSTIPSELIKYWINVQNGLIVQRKLDVLGGESVGSYEIDFSSDVISGSTAINFPSVDLKRYKKTISDSTFDYTITNCSISGWLIDYFKKTGDISDDYTIVEDPGNGINMFDDDLLSYADAKTAGVTAAYVLYEEVSFSSRSIKDVHVGVMLRTSNAASYAKMKLDACVNGSWVTVGTGTTFSTAFVPIFVNSANWNQDLVTGFRVYQGQHWNHTHYNYIKGFDLSAF